MPQMSAVVCDWAHEVHSRSLGSRIRDYDSDADEEGPANKPCNCDTLVSIR